MDKLILVRVRESDEELFVVKGAPSRYIDGEEFVLFKRPHEEKATKYIKRKSLIFNWK